MNKLIFPFTAGKTEIKKKVKKKEEKKVHRNFCINRFNVLLIIALELNSVRFNYNSLKKI